MGAIGRRLPLSDISSSCGLSFVFHGLLALAIIYVPQWFHGKPFKVPLNYEVTLVSPKETDSAQQPGLSLPAGQKIATAAVKAAAQPRDLLTLPSRLTPSGRTEEMTWSVKRRSSERQPPGSAVVPAAPPKIIAPQVASAPGISRAAMTPPVGQRVGAAMETGVMVGNTDPALAYYFVLIQDKITGSWMPPKMSPGTTASVTLSLRILRSGQVRDLAVGSSSGDRLLDDSALRAVNLSSPLPPLPPLFKAETLSLELRFTFVGERS